MNRSGPRHRERFADILKGQSGHVHIAWLWQCGQRCLRLVARQRPALATYAEVGFLVYCSVCAAYCQGTEDLGVLRLGSRSPRVVIFGWSRHGHNSGQRCPSARTRAADG
jgi:hypothetical protein